MNEKRSLFALPFVLIVLLVLAWVLKPERMTQRSITDSYELRQLDASFIRISEKAHVRSEPCAMSDGDGNNNSFGILTERGFTVEVSCAFGTDKSLDANGRFFGLRVEDILATPEGREWFPENITDDPDGIVWINHQYIEIFS